MYFSSPLDPNEHIQGVFTKDLSINHDMRGSLVEILRSDWPQVFDETRLPFAQAYYSITHPGIARDESRWHVHQKQSDRFVVIQGEIILALFDARIDSSTQNRLNLFKMGGLEIPAWHYMVLVPPRVLHGFCVSESGSATLLNFPSRLYDLSDEGRIPFEDARARFPDGELFTWASLRNHMRTR